MAYTLEQYHALQAAIAEGALSVRYKDNQVTYRSVDEMVRILKLMANDLAPAGTADRRRLTSFSKGY